MVLERMTEITATQLGVQEGYTPNPKIIEIIKRLPGIYNRGYSYGHNGPPDRREQAAGEEWSGSISPGHQHGDYGEYFHSF